MRRGLFAGSARGCGVKVRVRGRLGEVCCGFDLYAGYKEGLQWVCLVLDRYYQWLRSPVWRRC